MATTDTTARAERLAVLQRLLDVAQRDTVYRDVHRERAEQLAEPVLSRSDWDALRGTRAQGERLVEQTRRAVERRKWAEVKDLSARADLVRTDLAARSVELAVG